MEAAMCSKRVNMWAVLIAAPQVPRGKDGGKLTGAEATRKPQGSHMSLNCAKPNREESFAEVEDTWQGDNRCTTTMRLDN